MFKVRNCFCPVMADEIREDMPGDEGNMKEATTKQDTPLEDNSSQEKTEKSPTKPNPTPPTSPLKPKLDIKTEPPLAALSLVGVPKSSPKKNPWTKNLPPNGEEKKQQPSPEEVSPTPTAAAAGKDAISLTKSINIPKEEVRACECV